jgi:hypothetical protein
MDEAELAGSVDDLTTEVRALNDRIDTQQQVIDALKRHTRDIHSTRIMLVAALFGIILIFGLTGAFGRLYQQVETNQHQLQQVQARTSTEILCPLYEFLALSLRVNPPAPTATAEQVQLRKTAADTIARGLSTLGCTP